MQNSIRVNNPILSGFHADPSIVCANGEYYIANSTFEWYPGVEISKSSDLIHWTSVPSPLSEKYLLDMSGNKASCGIWAPCLSYSDGLFWLVFTNVRSWNVGPWKDAPNYITTAPSIEGPWSEPVFVNCSGFDASLFHDTDGKKWFVNMEWDYRKKGKEQFSGILLQEYDVEQKKLTGEVKKIFKGSDIGMVEGPHIYKRNGWYYLATAEGGTQYEHAMTVCRSRKIDGPYEIHPSNPLISSYGHSELRLQKAGHGSWCVSPDGQKTWLVFLCSRPLPGTKRCVLGRETGIAELVWINDWPYVIQNDGTLCNTPPDFYEIFGSVDTNKNNRKLLSEKGAQKIDNAIDKDQIAEKTEENIDNENTSGSSIYLFDNNAFLRDFKTLRIPFSADRYSLSARSGFLRIKGGESPVSTFKQSLLARRQTDFCFEAETKIFYSPSNFQHLAGLSYRYDEDVQYLLTVTYDETLGRVIKVLSFVLGELQQGVTVKIPDNDSQLDSDAESSNAAPVWLKLNVDYAKADFSWSLDGSAWHSIRPELDASLLSDEYGGEGFTGAFVGMFCVDTASYTKHCDFEYFKYTKK